MQNARKAPPYLQNGFIYQLFLRVFTPEGTLRAAQKLLPHIASLGATVVYLCPIALADDDMDPRYWSPRQLAAGTNNPKNPYRIKDFYQVDPEYGCDEDLRAFVREAHGCGLRVMLDLVYLHCGPGAVFLAEHPDFVLRDENGGFQLGEWAFPLHDFDNPRLRDYLWDNMTYWVREFDVDGYRCDVGSAIPLSFWEEGRRRLEAIKPDICMLCEGEREEDQLYAFDLNYAFTWYLKNIPAVMRGEAPASLLVDVWKRMHAAYPAGARQMRAIDTHGTADSATVRGARYEREWGHEAMDALLFLSFTVDGVPFFYNGTEVGDDAPQCVWADRFHARNMVIDWGNALTAHGQRRLALVRRLSALRKEAAFASGDTHWLDAPGNALVYERRQEGVTYRCAVNLGRQPVAVPREGELMLSSGEAGDALPAYGFALYRL